MFGNTETKQKENRNLENQKNYMSSLQMDATTKTQPTSNKSKHMHIQIEFL